jgi:hypothetical protein
VGPRLGWLLQAAILLISAKISAPSNYRMTVILSLAGRRDEWMVDAPAQVSVIG